MLLVELQKAQGTQAFAGGGDGILQKSGHIL